MIYTTKKVIDIHEKQQGAQHSSLRNSRSDCHGRRACAIQDNFLGTVCKEFAYFRNKTRPRMFQNARKYVVQHRKMVNMLHQNRILHSSWLTSQNASPSIGSLYKLPTLFAPFLFCDVIADKVYFPAYKSSCQLVYENILQTKIHQITKRSPFSVALVHKSSHCITMIEVAPVPYPQGRNYCNTDVYLILNSVSFK